MKRAVFLLVVLMLATETRLLGVTLSHGRHGKAARKTVAKKALIQNSLPRQAAYKIHKKHCAELIDKGEIVLPLPEPPPVSLEGSCEAQIWANQVMDNDNYVRVQSDEMLQDMVENLKLFLTLDDLDYIKLNPNLGERYSAKLERKYGDLVHSARMPVKLFESDFNASYAGEMQKHRRRPRHFWDINSAVRSPEYLNLIRLDGNFNTADASGPTESGHLAASTIDIAKKGMSRDQLKWARSKLKLLEASGKIQATEEHRQSVLHITVFESYASQRPAWD